MKKVNEVMTRDMHLATPDQTLAEVAAEMAKDDIGCLPVANKDRLVGMITDRDIVRRSTAQGVAPQAARVGDAMTTGVRYCFEDDACEDAAANMAANQIRRLPVVSRDKRLVGIVSLGDLANRGVRQPAGEALAEISRPSDDLLSR